MDGPQVTVLGAGIVGICTALSLAERGVRVRVIDRGAPGQETSFGNAGVISPWSIIPQAVPGLWRSIPGLMFGHARPLSVRASVWPAMARWGFALLRNCAPDKLRATADAMELLCGPSVDLYRRHLHGTGSEHLVVDSMYVHAYRDGSRLSLSALDYEIRQQKGADLELIGSDALRRLEPALSPAFQAAVLIKGQARALSPGQIGTALVNKARSFGVLFEQRDVQALARHPGQGWQITCAGASYTSPKVVLSMGAWSPAILEPLGYKVPLMAERGYHLEFSDPQIEINNSVMDVDAKCVASSMSGGVRFAGQAEFAPVDAPPDASKQALLTRLAQCTFPDLNTGSPSFWMGRRPSFPDSLPMLGQMPSEEGLFLNFGHSHYGLMMAPKSGELVADLIADRHSNADLSAYAPTRF